MEAPHLGNPRLTYNFCATPQLAIFLNNHHKRPSFCRLLSSILFNFFSLLYPFFHLRSSSARPSCPLHCTPIIYCEAFFSSSNSAAAHALSLTLLPLIYSSLSSCFYAHYAVCFQAP